MFHVKHIYKDISINFVSITGNNYLWNVSRETFIDILIIIMFQLQVLIYLWNVPRETSIKILNIYFSQLHVNVTLPLIFNTCRYPLDSVLK